MEPRLLAQRVLKKVFAGAYASAELGAALREHSLSARDAGLVTHLVYGTLRHAYALEQSLASLLTGKTQKKAKILLLTGAFEKLYLGTPDHAVVSEYVALARRAQLAPPALVNAVLRRVQRPERPEHTGSMAPWLQSAFQAAYGEQAQQVAASLLEPQPLWLWLGPQGRSLLEAEGHRVGEELAGCAAVELAMPLAKTAAYQKGEVQPINPASLACVHALGDVQGARVLDLAGGSGVKAAMLAARGAEVVSVELRGAKHQQAKVNFKRLGLRGDFVVHDLLKPCPLPPAHKVLLDAPCTGSGTLRAHPEIKLRLTASAVSEAATLQRALLKQAAKLVAEGGVLVYAVCSVFLEEGEKNIEAFLQEHPQFCSEPLHTAPLQAEPLVLDVPAKALGHGLLTLNTEGVDGFYIARLRKAASGT